MMADSAKSYILCINCGTSSLKFNLYQATSCALEFTGRINRIGEEKSHLKINDSSGRLLENGIARYPDTHAAAKELITCLAAHIAQYPLFVIVHRLVQGGLLHRQAGLITSKVLNDLKRYVYPAPNHLPDRINTITTNGKDMPEIMNRKWPEKLH